MLKTSDMMELHSVGHLAGWDVARLMDRLPFLAPGIGLALVLAVLASSFLGRWLRTRRSVAAVLILSAGIVMAATVTPLSAAAQGSETMRSCDLSRIGPAGWGVFSRPSDELANILLFIPLGVTIALLPQSSRRMAALAVAFLLPFMIETLQLVASPLGRSCQSADVVDNLTGLMVGILAGSPIERLARRRLGATPTPAERAEFGPVQDPDRRFDSTA